MRHLARVLHPRTHGLAPYRVVFRRAESHPLQSLLDEGLWYSTRSGRKLPSCGPRMRRLSLRS
jgi:hypothetical protein